ncbi:MAG: hypothetical protein IJ618_04365 [Prevotella sp.]|nr:hypothetical protein [Prevotella sp.]
MSYNEYFNDRYKGLRRKNYSTVCDMIKNYLWQSYDEELGVIKDLSKFKSAYKLCESAYNDLKEYEYLIEEDLNEINGDYGSPMLSYDDVPGIGSMSDICEMYHKHFEYFDISILPEEKEILEASKTLSETEKPRIIFKKDHDPEHRKWFVKILDSKIPTKESDKDQFLFDSLNRLFDKLCDSGYVDSDSENENRNVFIYRFSGFNDTYPLGWKILWKGKNIFLAYITRCLLSDKTNDPVGLGDVASFFQSKSGKPMNLSVKDCPFKDFEKEKNSLNSNFVKAVELLKECGFVNVELTSSRR